MFSPNLKLEIKIDNNILTIDRYFRRMIVYQTDLECFEYFLNYLECRTSVKIDSTYAYLLNYTNTSTIICNIACGYKKEMLVNYA